LWALRASLRRFRLGKQYFKKALPNDVLYGYYYNYSVTAAAPATTG